MFLAEKEANKKKWREGDHKMTSKTNKIVEVRFTLHQKGHQPM